jgi:plastocyanin
MVPTRLRLLLALLFVPGACGGGTGSGLSDGGPDMPADQGSIPGDLALESAMPDVPGESAASADAPGDAFLAIAPCADPTAYVSGVTSVATTGSSYNPTCLQVAVGASVTIEASLEHPLEPRPGGTPDNPILERQHTASVVFPTAGVFPYQCPEHVGNGMIGVIWVR